jgi:hypothetical protein
MVGEGWKAVGRRGLEGGGSRGLEGGSSRGGGRVVAGVGGGRKGLRISMLMVQYWGKKPVISGYPSKTKLDGNSVYYKDPIL